MSLYLGGAGTSMLFFTDHADATTLTAFLQTASGQPQPLGATRSAASKSRERAQRQRSRPSLLSHSSACLSWPTGEWTKFVVTDGRDVRRHGPDVLTSTVVNTATEVPKAAPPSRKKSRAVRLRTMS